MDDLRKDCPMRHENGNCTVIGGFCTAVNDPICEGLHNAYDNGYRDAALRAQQERENTKPMTNADRIRSMTDEELAELLNQLGTSTRERRMMIKLTQDEFGVLCLCALRYCHGRMTYMPSLIQSIVLQHKDELSDKDKACILQDKDFQRRCDLWGSDFDRADWERFYERLNER